jgi:hypothetical protein
MPGSPRAKQSFSQLLQRQGAARSACARPHARPEVYDEVEPRAELKAAGREAVDPIAMPRRRSEGRAGFWVQV